MNKKFLPIGTVVLLKNSQKRLMIVGLSQKQVDSDKIWDFSGCLYPEGIIDPERLYLFDYDQIEQIFFVGFQDPEGINFMRKLTAYVAQKEEEKG